MVEELRYEPVTDDVNDLCANLRKNFFMELFEANFICVFDSKRKMSKGKASVARIKKLNDELQYFSMDDIGVVYHYVIYIDKAVWEVLEYKDKERIMMHELYHCEVDNEKNNPYGLRDHEVQTFYAEIANNTDDPEWAERIAAIAESVYDI